MAMALSVAPISSDGSDVDLVAAVRRGSDAAFEELYSRYSQRIGAYVRGMVGDHGRAEDITQEIFIAALRRMRETERPIAFKPWIYEIAKNACIDNFRRTRRAQEVSLDADDGLSPADRGRLTVVTTPDAALDSKQALDDLRGAFGGLSNSHHEILVLREFEGRSYNDIGERLGMSRPVVESTLFRARRRLAEEYDELASGRRCAFVRKMVDSGPHYSLGLRDRRRIARHLAHCHSCRAYARVGGFDASILSMPRIAAKIAALLPIPLLRARWGGVENVSADRARPSLLTWRSVHTLARSSDVLVVAGPGAGRGAATAAAIVLAGVGGGIVTVSSEPGVPHRSVVHTLARDAHSLPIGLPDASALRIARGFTGALLGGKSSLGHARALSLGGSHAGLGAAAPHRPSGAGISSLPARPVGAPATDPGQASSGTSSTSGGDGPADGSTTGAAGPPAGAGGSSKGAAGNEGSSAGSGGGSGSAGSGSNANGTGTVAAGNTTKGPSSTSRASSNGSSKWTTTVTTAPSTTTTTATTQAAGGATGSTPGTGSATTATGNGATKAPTSPHSKANANAAASAAAAGSAG